MKTINRVYATHTPTREHTRALRDTYAIDRVPPKISHTRPEGSTALIIEPIIDGFHLTKVLMDGGSSLNLLYQDIVHKMGIDPSRIKPTTTILKGPVPGIEAHCTGSVTLEVIFGSPNNFRSEGLTFDIAPFHSGYHALLGHTAFARFNAVPLYALAKLKMTGPCGVITINGNMGHSFRTGDYIMTIIAKAQSGLVKPHNSSPIKPPVSIKWNRSVSEQD